MGLAGGQKYICQVFELYGTDHNRYIELSERVADPISFPLFDHIQTNIEYIVQIMLGYSH